MQSGIAAAYLGMSRHAYRQLEVMAAGKSMYPSLMTSHEPGQKIFNVDANGSIPELVNSMLFFSWPGRLDLLRSLPEELPRGSLHGVLARGRIRIDRLAWDWPAGRIDLDLTSCNAQTVTLRLPEDVRIISAEVDDIEAAIEVSAGTANHAELELPGSKTVCVRIGFVGC